MQQVGPVDGVVVAEVGVLTDEHAAVVDLTQRSQPQRGEGWDMHHPQGETPETGEEETTGTFSETSSK